MKWGTSPDTDPMILLQDVCHARKSGGEDGQLWDNGRGPRQGLRLMTPRLQQIITSTNTTTSTRALHEDEGRTASPPQAKQTLFDLCEGLAGHHNRLLEASDADPAPLLRGTSRRRAPPPGLSHDRRLPCGDSARDDQDRNLCHSSHDRRPPMRRLCEGPAETSHRPASHRLQDYLN